MRNKLLAGIAALAIGIGVASCGENEEPASKQSSSKAPEAQQTPLSRAPSEPEGQPSGQTASQAPAGQEKQPESGPGAEPTGAEAASRNKNSRH